ncbi:MAG TPA: peptidoglycan DD-metalloendopeptidase family protein [Gaiellaceae bacterium]|nr:peptidoglycan DD-metalloendopeptidase family protein [Gaiellaceae bacterium]
MRRLAPVLLAVLALVAVPAAAGQLSATPRSLPSHTVPNGAGSIRVPQPISRPPARPETRSYDQLVTLWKQAGAGYGVPWQVLGAINKIETGYGQNMGPSSAGAVGWMQFLPSTWMRWGMDADGDGLANPWDPEDAVFAAARYLAAAGAHESIERAIFAYNHAQWYVDDVLALAATLGDAPFTAGPTQLTLDPGPDLGRKLERARTRVQRLSDALDLALGRIGERDWQRLRLERRLGDPSLSDAEFAELDGRLAKLDQVERASQAEIDSLQARFAKAVEALKRIKAAQEAAALGTGLAGGGYVFPVAGEASFSDSFGVPRPTTWHHGIDIFAPLGTPLVAVADGTLFNVGWNDVGGNRLWLRDGAGNEFYYAHLAGFSPIARDGAVVRAGDVVGFVGDTGDAQGTSPHLHFELHPPDLRDQGYDGVVNPYPYLVAWRAGVAAGGQQSFDGWVFPVGGGPANVSTARTHHDYPAADIAAPMGSPVYALHDAVVTDTFRTDSGRCGIGLTLRVTTGEEFVYCHLSWLDPGLAAGRTLVAGEEVGRVGSTGNSTGPHLHLGFRPSTSYPQAEAWFQAFAGIAFRWQDGATLDRSEALAMNGLKQVAGAPGQRVFKVIRKRVITFTTTG